MKKLFFTALVAVVAVGGALASNLRLEGRFFTEDNSTSTPNINCIGTGAACSAQYPGVTTVYTEPSGAGTSFNLVGSSYTYQP